jgi:tetratricopeptide (TPR) repeat protein
MEESAMPYFQRALELDPGYGPAIQGLARSIATVGHAEPHLDWLRRQAASTGDEREMFWIATALLAADLEAEAVALYRRMTATHGACWPPQFYVQYLCWNNRASEAEAALREALEVASAASATTGCDVEQSVLGNRLYTTVDQGRLREWWELSKGWSVIERNPRIAAGQRITFAAAFTRDATELRKALEELDRMEPGQEHLGQALQLAKHGHLDLAFQRAVREIDGPGFADLDPESQRMAEAVVAWGRGAREDAERKISATASRPGSHGAARLAAEFAFARGDCARVIQTLEPLRALRWSWNLSGLIFGMPRSLHLLATCHERTGDFAKARERNDELLRRWARADPELPYLIEAKAMQERLGVK